MSENRVLQAASIRGTGVFCALSRELAEQHGLDTTEMDAGESETDTFWRPKHGMEPLQATIQRSLQRTHERFGDDYYDGPTEVDEPLFNEIEANQGRHHVLDTVPASDGRQSDHHPVEVASRVSSP